MYEWVTFLYCRKGHNIVNQLYINKKGKKMKYTICLVLVYVYTHETITTAIKIRNFLDVYPLALSLLLQAVLRETTDLFLSYGVVGIS